MNRPVALLFVVLSAAPVWAQGGPPFLKTLRTRATFDALSQPSSGIAGAAGAELKFLVSKLQRKKPVCRYFDSKLYPSHYRFAKFELGEAFLLRDFRRDTYFSKNRKFLAGTIAAHDAWLAEDGTRGLYTLGFWPADTVDAEHVALAYQFACDALPFAKGRIRYHPSGNRQRRLYAEQKERLETLGVPVITTEALYDGRDSMALNPGVGIGTLRVLGAEKPKTPVTFRDVVVYRFAPNDLPHVAGVITEEPQTPLSHINLVARQNKTPNAYLKKASQDPRVLALAGKLVRLHVTPGGVEIKAATPAQAQRHWKALRPTKAQRPRRDLRARAIKPLHRVRFKERHAYGAKTTGVAELARVKPALHVPKGYGVPFYYYDRFMKELGFYDAVKALLADPKFTTDPAQRRDALKALRADMKKAKVPKKLAADLEGMHKRFPAGRALRCRSSANNEDLEGFSGAGLYNSYTHRKDEGSITKSIKQVWASLWTYRAFEERSFWRIDHLRAAMGVLVHPNFDDELANGVAVSKNLLAPRWEGTYVNVQKGEQQSVTNPLEAQPDEFVVTAIGPFVRGGEEPTSNGRARETIVLRRSSLLKPGETVLTPAQVLDLDVAVRAIHDHFAPLYHKAGDLDFAVDVEFKIDAGGVLVFKQSRPWVE